MRKLFTLLIVVAFATAALGCEKKEDTSNKADKSAKTESKADKAEAKEAEEPEEADKAAAGEEEAEEGDEVAMVEVPAKGKEFDPAVEKSRVPAGTWICDMGTVHWAGKEKPEDGKCPVCGMQLKKHEHAGDSPK